MATDSQLSKMNSSKDPPSYEETTQVSRAAIIASLISQLENARNGNSVLSILSDNELGVDDKCIAMEYTDQIPAIAEEKEAMLLENALRLQGSHRLAQSVCYYYNTRHTSKDRVWCRTLIEADIEIRWIVQRMIWVQQHLRTTRTIAFRQHLKKLNQQYWRAHRKLWIAEDGIDSRCAARAFAFQRTKIDWYLSRELSEDCARQGGCCGRTCGCCERLRTIDGLETEGMPNRGHCTSACSCCLNAHGLDGNDIGDEITDLQDLHFDATNTQYIPDPHTLRLLKGYVFYF